MQIFLNCGVSFASSNASVRKSWISVSPENCRQLKIVRSLSIMLSVLTPMLIRCRALTLGVKMYVNPNPGPMPVPIVRWSESPTGRRTSVRFLPRNTCLRTLEHRVRAMLPRQRLRLRQQLDQEGLLPQSGLHIKPRVLRTRCHLWALLRSHHGGYHGRQPNHQARHLQAHDLRKLWDMYTWVDLSNLTLCHPGQNRHPGDSNLCRLALVRLLYP